MDPRRVEVGPDGYDYEVRSIAAARDFWKRVNRPNVMIKIPGTREGLPAIEQGIYDGININITLLFAVEAYERVTDAYLTGLERRQAEGKSLDVASVASFFVSRVDTAVDKRLEALGREELYGKAAIANARHAYRRFEAIFSGPRWEALHHSGAHVQRPLWASTSVKNPRYPDTMYVVDLVTADTVNTMPEATLRATADHGVLRGDTIHGTYEESQAVFDSLEELGISYDDVVQVLEDEGVSKFEVSWTEMLQQIQNELSLKS